LKAGGFNKRNPEAKIMTVDNLFIFHGKLTLLVGKENKVLEEL